MLGASSEMAGAAPDGPTAAAGRPRGTIRVEPLSEEAFPTMEAWAEAVAELTRRAFSLPAGWSRELEPPGAVSEAPARVLADRRAGARVWVARTPGGAVAGIARGLPGNDGSWTLKRLGVLPDHRQRGVAACLVRAVEDDARAAGARRVVLHCVVERLLPQVYARLGYRVVQRWPHDEKALTVVAMERDLADPPTPYPGPWEAEAALPRRGVYLLWLWLPGRVRLPVPAPTGSTLGPGLFAYAGSAQQALPARLNRHVTGTGTRHWHVDHLRSEAQVVGVDVWPDAPREAECRLAELLARAPNAADRTPRFGSGDCRCAGHLVGLGPRPEEVPAYRAPRRLQDELLAVFRPLSRPWHERRLQR